MRKFQQLVLLLDPMLQASFHLISLYLPYALNNFTHSDLDYFYHVLSDPDLQGEVDAVNARVAERQRGGPRSPPPPQSQIDQKSPV